MLPALLFACLAHLSTVPSKGYYALADRIDHATVICIGTVTEVVELTDEGFGGEGRPFARVAVERVLEGDPGLREVWHEAWPTWMCDGTSARLGERCLFLLGESTEVARAALEVRTRVLQRLGVERVYRNVGSGDGLLTIRADGVVFMTGDPPALRIDGRVQLADLEAYTRDLLEFSPEKLTLFARFGGPSMRPGPFDLRVRSDGEVRLAGPLGWKEEVRRFRLEPERLERLLALLQVHVRVEPVRLEPVRLEPVRLGRAEEARLRHLVVCLPSGELEFHEDVAASGSWPPREPALRAAFDEAERAWQAVLDFFAADSEWIGRQRDARLAPR